MNNINSARQKIIKNFIHSYNTFDIYGMLKCLDEDIKFENISNGQIDVSTNGINEFKLQAESAKNYFKERQSKIIKMNFEKDRIEVIIDYYGILAKDFSDSIKAGDTIRLKGRSIYRFKNNKIISIQDIS